MYSLPHTLISLLPAYSDHVGASEKAEKFQVKVFFFIYMNKYFYLQYLLVGPVVIVSKWKYIINYKKT